MTEVNNIDTSEQIGPPRLSASGIFGLVSLGFMSVCFLTVLILVIASVGLNFYLGWQLSGLEVAIGTRVPTLMTGQIIEITATPVQILNAVPTNTPQVILISTPTAGSARVPTARPTPMSSSSQRATESPASDAAQSVSPGRTSSNSYELIPVEWVDRSRPADENPDLNLKLREPIAAKAAISLIDIPDSGVDPDAPNLGAVFLPEFTSTYSIHEWDKECDCIGDLAQDEFAVLLGIKTTPGQGVYIPPRQQDIYVGKFYAVVVYASEDSLTFMYHRGGNIVTGYAVHYEGIRTDPNLLALYRSSKGNELPGLTLDTPVGLSTDELMVAMRNNGTFLDVRSRKDWWD